MTRSRAGVTVAAFFVGLSVFAGLPQPAAAGDSNGNFQIKAGVSGVWTDDETKKLSNGTDLLAAGNSASTDDMVLPTLTLTYFFNRNVAVELFCCFGKTSIDGERGLKGNGELAETWMFPPILTAQYHFDGFGAMRPYVGAGVEWIHYFNEDVGKNGLGASKVDLKDSFGFALQAGVDFDLGSGWTIGLDVKKVWEDTEVKWTDSAVGNVKAEHDIDPLIVTANLGYRFNLADLFGRREAVPLK